jgi:two-component system, chemotaxis family, sensor kinase CheA
MQLMTDRTKKADIESVANHGSPDLDDALALLVRIVPGKAEDFNKLSEVLARVLTGGSLDENTAKLVSAAKGSADRWISGERSNPEDVLIAISNLLEAASHSREMNALGTFSAAPDPVLHLDTDTDLLIEFVMESRELLDHAESMLLALEQSPDDAEAVNTVFRAFHTVKGTSGFIGLKPISELAHLAESLLTRARSGEIQLAGEYADLALRSIDMLRKTVGSLECSAQGARLCVPAGFEELKAVLFSKGSGSPELGLMQSGLEKENGESEIPDARSPGTGRQPVRNGSVEHDPSVRVNTARLDRLLDLVGELVIAQSMVVQDPRLIEESCRELQGKVTHAGKIIRELQALSMSMRMVPLGGTFEKMQRVVRDLARKTGKKVELIIDGGGTEIDRHMVAVLSEVLVHMIRNAVDHGIELPDERSRLGKPETGTVRLAASYSGGTVVVEIRDDGRGLNRDEIMRQARSAGLVAPEKALSDGEIFNLIFAAGLSTSERVTDSSGRGVGMDVVKKGVESLHGRIEIQSAEGQGAAFLIRLPLTLAVTDGMLVKVGSERYIIPTIGIHLCFRPEPECLSTIAGKGELVLLRGEMMPLLRLHRLFEIRSAIENPSRGILVVVGGHDGRCAVLVDELLGQQQVVAKPLGKKLGRIQGITGGAILGDGQVGLILDPIELCQLVS